MADTDMGTTGDAAAQFQAEIVRQVSDAVIAIDDSGVVTYLNRAAERQYGTVAAMAVGRPLSELYRFAWIEPADETAAIQALERVGHWRGENRHVLSDGRTLRVESSVSVLRSDSGARVGVLAVIRDITAARQAEEALRDRDERQAFLLRLSDALRPLDDAREIKATACRVLGEALQVNRAFYAEIEADDWMVTRHYEHQVAPLPDGAYSAGTYGHWIMDTYRTGRRIIFRDTQSDPRFALAEREAHASAGIISAVGIPLVKNGRLAAILAVHRAVSHEWTDQEIGLIDETAERTWAEVERAKAEAALRASEAQLKDEGRRKDEFLAMLAHELRNPLAPIRTGLELIRVAGNTPAAVEQVRSLMDRQVRHMVRLIDDLLDVSRISSGKISLQREPTPLNSMVTSAIDANRSAIAAKRLTLNVDLAEATCVVDVDPTRFVQVLSNLLDNATKFTDAGGTITISGRVNGGEGTAGREATLSVSDSGHGISPEFLPRVFDLFAQGNTGSAPAGLGIGLALARRLIEMQGGTIDVRSEGRGRGTEFVIRIPVSSELPKERPAAVPDSHVDCRVLVIDDNRDAADALAMLIEAIGGNCRTAYDGESGLRELRQYRPDAVLLDIAMPGLDGYETCRRIRQQLGDDVMVVALTGFGQEHDKEEARRAGFDEHLTKPADPVVLERVLAQRKSASE